jgi:hypothetical protein
MRQMKPVIFVGCYAGIRGLPLSRPIQPYLVRRGACLQSMLVDQSPVGDCHPNAVGGYTPLVA